MTVRRSAPLLALGLAMLAGCQEPDVGQSCSFDLISDAPLTSDFLETGKTECENLVCIQSPVPASGWTRANPYCSKPCVSNDDCAESETGLVCRSVVLDPDFLANLPEEVRARYLGDVQFSNYCAIPR